MRALLARPVTDEKRRQTFDDGQPDVSVDYVTRPHAYSSERVRRALGFVPRVDIDEGFRRIAASLQ